MYLFKSTDCFNWATEENAIKLGYELNIGNFPFIGNGKALAMGEEEGFVKQFLTKKQENY